MSKHSVDELLSKARAKLSQRLSPEQAWAEMQNGAILIDIRNIEQREHDGVIPGAVQINRNVLEWRCDPSAPWIDERLKKDDYDQKLIILCNQGYQSSLAAANLVFMGLAKAADVDGGYEAWRASGQPWEPYSLGK